MANDGRTRLVYKSIQDAAAVKALRPEVPQLDQAFIVPGQIIEASDEEGNYRQSESIDKPGSYDNGEWLVDDASCITGCSKFRVQYNGYEGKYIEPKKNLKNAPLIINHAIDKAEASEYLFLIQ